MDTKTREDVVENGRGDNGKQATDEVLIEGWQAVACQEHVRAHDERRNEERDGADEEIATEHDGDEPTHGAPGADNGGFGIGVLHRVDIIQDLLRHGRRRGAGVDGADEAVNGGQLGEVHGDARRHAEDVEVAPVRACANGRVDGDRVHQDGHVAVVQAIRGCDEVNLRLDVGISGASRNQDFANARGDLHDARDLRGVSEIDWGERGGRWCGLCGVNSGDGGRTVQQALA